MYEKPLITPKRRSAFTLIELLVVIAIIAILAALLVVAVVKIMGKGPVVKNTSETANIGEALQQFKKNNGGYYPPSILKLCSDRSLYGNSTVDMNSVAFLNAMYPNLGNFTGMNWAGRPGFVAGNQVIDILDGDQAMVFALAGPPNVAGDASKGMKSFSTNPQNPLDTATDRKKYYDFPADRLYNRDMTTAAAQAFLFLTTGNKNFYAASIVHPFPSFLDAFGTSAGLAAPPGTQPIGMPLIYFSANRRANGYDLVPNSLDVVPYCIQTQPALKFCNPDSFQLISAGPDGISAANNKGGFGKGGFWPVTATWSAAATYVPFDGVTYNGVNYLCVSANKGSAPPSANWKANPFGGDDYANFTDKALGVP